MCLVYLAASLPRESEVWDEVKPTLFFGKPSAKIPLGGNAGSSPRDLTRQSPST